MATLIGTVVGEAPGFAGEGKEPLSGSIGDRLGAVAGLGDRLGLATRFELRNVLDYFPGRSSGEKGSAFPLEEAREAAARIRPTLRGPVVLFLGKRVANAFEAARGREYLEWFEYDGRMAAIVPHTSGVNRWWNDWKNERAARRFFDELLGEAP